MKNTLIQISIFAIILFILARCKKDDFLFNPSDNFYIADTTFLNALLDQGVDKNGDGKISYEEAEAVTVLKVDQKDITFLAGIEMFVNLDTLSCEFNNLMHLDVSKNNALRYLNCRFNQLTSLDVSYNEKLESLDCSVNQLYGLDLSKNTALKVLWCGSNQLSNLDISKNVETI